MKKKFCEEFLPWLLASLFVTFSIALLPGTCLSQQDGKDAGPPPVPVKMAEVEKKSVTNQITLIGTAEPVTESTVASEASGRVEIFAIDEGDFVQKGDVLAKLNDRELRLELKGAVAVKEAIRARLSEAEKELERMKKLIKTDSVAQRKYDEAFYSHEVLRQDYLKSLADIEQLEYDIEKKKVRAPFSGFISKEHTQLGQWIQEGGPVATLIDISDIQVMVDVPERYAVDLNPGEPAKVVIKSLSHESNEGSIKSVLPQGDPKARTFPVKILLNNPDFRIKSGMEAQVAFVMHGRTDALLIPKDAIVLSGKDRIVYVIKNGAAVPVTVTVTGYHGTDVSIEAELAVGDKVVTRGNERLRPNQPVKVID